MQSEITSNKTQCPHCSSKDIRKFGIKKSKLLTQQRYQCKSCKKVFLLQSTNKTYPITTILKAVTLHNLGHSQSKIKNLLKTSHQPSQKTISNWINEFKEVCPYSRFRNEAKQQFQPENIIDQYEFLHSNLNYKYQIHNFKLNYLTSNNEKFQRVKDYLNEIPTQDFPHHIFKSDHNIKEKSDRASQTNFKILNIKPLNKQNIANNLCKLALNLAKTNKERHQSIQNFFITNDSTTIATEIPIYLTHDDLLYFNAHNFSLNPNDFSTPITGHIDILQIRNNLIHILDYKPEANN